MKYSGICVQQSNKSTPWNNILYNKHNLNVTTELLLSIKFIFSNLNMYQLSLVEMCLH